MAQNLKKKIIKCQISPSTQFTSIGLRADPSLLAVSLQVPYVINPTSSKHHKFGTLGNFWNNPQVWIQALCVPMNVHQRNYLR